jgi:hypothetical protein
MADLQEALNAHDRVRKSTDLPLFFGRKDKDTVHSDCRDSTHDINHAFS